MKNPSSTAPDMSSKEPATMTTLNTLAVRPWYKEPWPWLLMAGPAIVVVAGFVTLYYAITSFDGLVSDDYYKRGLTVNQDLSRRARAAELGVVANLTHDAPGRRVTASVKSRDALPATLDLRFLHPTRAGSDQRVNLKQTSTGQYEGMLLLPPLSHWNVVLEGTDWSLGSDWQDTANKPLTLGVANATIMPSAQAAGSPASGISKP